MGDESNIEHQIDVEYSIGRAGGSLDAAIAELAERQHGVVARWQLLGLGLGRGAIARRVEMKRLHLIHRGVYAVGHRRISRMGWWMAAVLACGPDAVLSHRSAAVLWGILEGSPASVDVTAPRELAGRAGIRVHTAALADDERTVEAGIPVTTVARTLLDLAAVLQLHELNRGPGACRGTTAIRPDSLGCPRHAPPTSPWDREAQEGARAGTAAAGPHKERAWETLSHLRRAGRLAAAADERLARDRRRDRRLLAAGWRVARVTDKAMEDEPTALRAELAALVAEGDRKLSA